MLNARHSGNTLRLAKQLEELTRLEARVTILGYVQRGGTPSAGDRLLATRLGTMCLELIQNKVFGVMVAARGDGVKPVPISDVAGRLKTIPPEHPWWRARGGWEPVWGTKSASMSLAPRVPAFLFARDGPGEHPLELSL